MAERPEAHTNLGTLRAEQGDVAAAEAEFRTAIRLQPDYVPAYANLADVHRALGRDADAAKTLTTGWQRRRTTRACSTRSACLRVREKRLDDALPLLARARPRHVLTMRASRTCTASACTR